jgi:Predicted transcriptional regulator
MKSKYVKADVAANIREMILKVSSRSQVKAISQIPMRTLDSYISGDAEPKLSAALAIAESLQTTVEYMALRTGPKKLDNEFLESYIEWKNLGECEDEKLNKLVKLEKRIQFVDKIENLDLEELVNQSTPNIPLNVSFDYIREFHLRDIDHDRLMVTKMAGSNMSPKIESGEIIEIDQSKTELIDGEIFLFEQKNIRFVREVHLVPGKGFTLININSDYTDTSEVTSNMSDLKINGRVVSVKKFL